MFYVILLVIIELLVFAANYTYGTYLIGWDNVMPEFNLWLNFKRSLFSVWQDYRGLGVLDGMAHSVNLFHTIYISFLSTFLPQSLVRYVFIHLTHLAGGIGFFYLAKYLTKNSKGAFLGALFYMFNIGVIQMYFAPLEVFAVSFAALPILALLITKTLKSPNRKNLLFLFLASLLTSPQGFVPTIFIVFLILLGTILGTYIIKTRLIKRAAIVGLTVLMANAFWLLPYVYSAVKSAPVIQKTRINEFSSEEIFYRNYTHGNLGDVLKLKGFMLDGVEFDTTVSNKIFLMEIWQKHQSGILYQSIFFIFLGIALIGIIKAFGTSNNSDYLPYLITLFISFLFLANRTIIFEQINGLIRVMSPTFGEAFRFPFTKFITMFSFCLSVFVAIGASFLLKKFKRWEKPIIITVFVGLIYLFYPVFQGNFTSPLLRQKLPEDYISVFKYFDSVDENQRIVVLPIQSFWNWQYRSFGQRGSGFLWYGIKQPILERAFDPWSNFNEQFYNELSYAINTSDEQLFIYTLKKYDIKYILLDQYIVNTLSKTPIDYVQLRNFLDKPFLTKQVFGRLIVYKTDVTGSPVFSLRGADTANIFPYYINEHKDNFGFTAGNYVSKSLTPDITPLFPSLYSGKLQDDLEFSATQGDKSIFVYPKKYTEENVRGDLLEIPSIFENEFLIPVEVRIDNSNLILTPVYPRVYINGKEVNFTKNDSIVKQISINPVSLSFVDTDQEIENLESENKGYILNNYVNVIKLKSDSGQEELVTVDTKNIIKTKSLIAINEQKIESVEVVIDKIESPFSFNKVIENKEFEVKRQPNQGPQNSLSFSVKTENGVNIQAKSGSVEFSFYNGNLYHLGSYILFVDADYKSGLPVNFYLDNPLENRSEFEAKLSKKALENVIIIPKTENYFQGYGFHFIFKSVGVEKAESTIKNISLYPFPLETLKNIKVISPRAIELKANTTKSNLNYKKTGNYKYEIKDSVPENNYLVLSQSFDPGWKVYEVQSWLSAAFPFIFGTELKNHVLVNNWENGWVTENSKFEIRNSKLVIIYLPQYLEYFGFILMFVFFLFIAVKKLNKFNF
ncbi:MAG: hypothetical protein M1524_00940 [Patescibacteria group bacterium]|nr:hypothetical protein [Patescibacteria group bacterium]